MNESEIYVEKEFKLDNPGITDIDSILDSCLKIVITIIFKILYMNVSLILNLQISLIMKYLT